jgi:riboflavin synthase
MFTGIITAIGRVQQATIDNDGLEFAIAVDWPDLQLGDSIAIDGACLTVSSLGAGWFGVHVITTSLGRTAFAAYQAGRRVNLERALAVGDRLGGHLVQGHVDGIGTIVAVGEQGDAVLLDLTIPDDVARISIPLGSITIDGVSLTINAILAPGVIQVSLIPFTLLHTTLGERRTGDAVHVEGDTVGKYIWQFTLAHRATLEG